MDGLVLLSTPKLNRGRACREDCWEAVLRLLWRFIPCEAQPSVPALAAGSNCAVQPNVSSAC